MKNFLATAAIAMACLALPSALHAQDAPPFFKRPVPRADAAFSLCAPCVNHVHTAWLGAGNKMTVNLNSKEGYAMLPDAEALLAQVSADIAFVRDTIAACTQCNYRIDYALGDGDVKQYRIRRYEPKGAFLYQKGDGDLRPYKPEADTLNIVLKKEDRNAPWGSGSAQIILVLNRLANLDSLLAQKGKLNHIIDTFRALSGPKTRWEKKHSYAGSSTIFIYKDPRDTARQRVVTMRGVHKEDDYQMRPARIGAQIGLGAGFLRSNIAPTAQFGIVYRLPSTIGEREKLVLGLYVSGYFGFSGAASGEESNFKLHDNYFLNAEFGGEGEENLISNLKRSRLTLGLGYLLSQKGDYFRGATMKAFMNIRLMNGITLSPEVIATDNFKKVFPGFTVKIF